MLDYSSMGCYNASAHYMSRLVGNHEFVCRLANFAIAKLVERHFFELWVSVQTGGVAGRVQALSSVACL